MELIQRSDIPEMLAKFGMTYSDAGVQAALRELGIKPTRYQGIAGGKGRIALFDPMVAWLIASAWEAKKRRLKGLNRAMVPFRDLYAELKTSPDAKWVPGFADDDELGAQLLMLVSPGFAMEPRDIRRVGLKNPDVFDMSKRGRDYLVNILQGYNDVYGRSIDGRPVNPSPGQIGSPESQTREFLIAWLHETRMRFEIGEFEADGDGEEVVSQD